MEWLGSDPVSGPFLSLVPGLHSWESPSACLSVTLTSSLQSAHSRPQGAARRHCPFYRQKTEAHEVKALAQSPDGSGSA